MNHSKSYEALKKIVQEFANNSTTGQEAMQIGRAAPTTAWPPSVAETSQDSWEEYGAINATGSQQCWICKGYGPVSRDCPNGKGKGKGKDNFGKGKGPYEWGKSNYDGNKAATGCTREVERRTVRALMLPSRSTRKVTASLAGKDSFMASATLAVEIILHEIAPKALEAWETWEEPPLVEHVFCHRYEKRMQVHSECRDSGNS